MDSPRASLTDSRSSLQRVAPQGVASAALVGTLPDAAPDAIATTDAARAVRSRRSRRGDRWPARVLPPVLLGLALLGLWQLLWQTETVAEYLLPSPANVARALRLGVESGLFWDYARVTLQESLVGFCIGALIALPVGYGIAHSRLLDRALQPYLAASQAVPAIAIAPLFVLWLGYGLRTVAALCALIVFFPMVMNTALGIRRLDADVLDAARVDGAGRRALLLHFEVPLALPIIMVGVRTSLTLSITGAVVGEFVLGDQGLGGLLTIARGSFNTPLVFATIIVLMVMATAMYFVAWSAEQLLARRQR